MLMFIERHALPSGFKEDDKVNGGWKDVIQGWRISGSHAAQPPPYPEQT